MLREIVTSKPPASLSRRELLSILPAGVAGCLGCAARARCATQAGNPLAAHSPTEKADITWEEVFRFAFKQNYIPTLKAIAAQIGQEKFVSMLQETVSEMARKGAAARAAKFTFADFAAGLTKNVPPLYQHALSGEIVEQTAQTLEYKVTQCLWARMFREENAADIGYAVVCHPDYAIASGLSPKLKLTRNKTLMQGHDCCNLRYVMEG